MGGEGAELLTEMRMHTTAGIAMIPMAKRRLRSNTGKRNISYTQDVIITNACATDLPQRQQKSHHRHHHSNSHSPVGRGSRRSRGSVAVYHYTATGHGFVGGLWTCSRTHISVLF